MRALVILLSFLIWSPFVQAQTPAPPSQPVLTPAQAQGVLDVLQDDKKRQAFVTVLHTTQAAFTQAWHRYLEELARAG